MNPYHWTGLQWWGFAAAAIGLIGAGAWWQDLVSVHHVATIQSGTLTVSGVINLLLGKQN